MEQKTEDNIYENSSQPESSKTNEKDSSAVPIEEDQLKKAEEAKDEDDFDFAEIGADDSGESESERSERNKEKGQSKSQRAEFARKRRQREAKEKEERLKSESYNRGLKEAVNGVNPYTNEKMEDEEDIEIYKTMKEIEKRGGNPIEDYAKYQKIFKREARERESKASEEKAVERAKLQKNMQSFKEAYPDVNLSDLLKNEDFDEFARASINSGESLTSVYERYSKFISKHNERIKQQLYDESLKKEAKSKSSTGSLTSKDTVEKEYTDLSREEKEVILRKKGFIN